MVIECALFAVRFKIGRGTIVRQKANMEVFAMFICFLASTANAVAQFESGTVILIGYSKNKIIMAADSRAGDEGKAPTDDACKITTLNKKLVFSATGRIFDKTNGIIGWNAPEQAKQAFTQISNQRPVPSDSFTRDVTLLWAELVTQNIANHIRPEEYATLRPHHLYLDGIFAGIGPTGNIQTGYVVIGSDIPSGPGSRRMGFTQVREMSLSDTVDYFVLGGHAKTLNEFISATTRRARAEKAVTLKQSRTWPFLDADARMAIRLTELIIKYADHPENVHGPVDAVEVDNGGTMRWVQRKPNCPQN